MEKAAVKGSLFDDDVDVNNYDVMRRRLDFLQGEMTMPPNSMKSVIDKTAAFVKKNGKIFEQKIYKEKEKQFSFINPSHPYFYYYQYKLHELFIGAEEKTLIPKAILEIKKREDQNKASNNEHILKICDFIKEDNKQEKNKIIYAINDQSNEEIPQGKEEKIEVKEDIYTVTTPFISSVDVDLIKTTALFVARNGNQFLNELIDREKNNNQYDFLRANNLYFNYFSKLIDIYVKCLLPNDDIIDKLKKYSTNKNDIINYSYSIYNFNMKKKEEEERKMEQKTKCDTFYDWTNFSVVETITFDENDDYLPQSIDFNNVENYVLSQLFDTDKKYTNLEKIKNISYHDSNVNKTVYGDDDMMERMDNETFDADTDKQYTDQTGEEEYYENGVGQIKMKGKHDSNGYEEESLDSSQEKENVGGKKHVKQGPKGTKMKEENNDAEGDNTLDEEQVAERKVGEEDDDDDENEEKIIVVKNYEKSKKHRLNNQNMHLCPITNQPIDINDMTKHLKTLLLDPQWKEQKDKLYEKAKKEASFTPLEDIEGNLSLFVINRPDLFGSIDEEINEHTLNENKKNTKNMKTNKKEEDVYSYIHNIYNKILPGPSMAHYPQNAESTKKDSIEQKSKKQRKG
ncbi:splicing factor 3A subunit 1, putative [Plasmodium knowlesi strain H]|uniref:Splicing factor 3A subunit 1, putative n=3 Tax=Plasmodium knowlesi TaxID=5850 RepID=A0A5K1UUJ4_PLAKH|nr:splicing factor 3A subunit 1, putative [Plasmodium knowlesi strain H]OTN65462.1 putative RNA-binding protein [Plasmodium knowlesi]CAA9989773.1 splicing factor 3A subunit 1, putative [Plasmodium knowlesi strain H]SBO22943.1 splicing factor 3A subunit 1, putative [Plasmodium knowlesi strain H]SBO22954.1 splicing factor 3A subunit 1, putative [Plasmodium knowlesi strain H]VVS79247.1 splicing factor 3A subunit 1, putative [Plasmodium knowlesi strain H]|eukprot:XP_002260496.1 RNA-binding protein, putative [Plasmodium knowlesi strain H]